MKHSISKTQIHDSWKSPLSNAQSHLVRIEFSPEGLFEDRQSMLALPSRQPLEFQGVLEEGEWRVLKTGTDSFLWRLLSNQ